MGKLTGIDRHLTSLSLDSSLSSLPQTLAAESGSAAAAGEQRRRRYPRGVAAGRQEYPSQVLVASIFGARVYSVRLLEFVGSCLCARVLSTWCYWCRLEQSRALLVVQPSLAQPQAKLPASLMNGEQFLRPLLFSSVLAADF